ncbi:MAG: hypothetical protein FJ271_25650 [Planctomycetes bacterium]|nr:hypothetical protein [Planctomycetota bacterium]
MKSRLVLSGACVIAFLLGVWHNQPSAGQTAGQNATAGTKQASKIGKYQIATVNNVLHICDTETGHVWGKSPAGWNPVAWTAPVPYNPAPPKK